MRRRSPAVIAFSFTLVCAPTVFAEEPPPQLEWGRAIVCMDGPGHKVVRVQCDDAEHPRLCLVAPNETAEGSELHRVHECPRVESRLAYDQLVSQGAHMVPAIAESPPGFSRSEKGRAYQTKFDLLERVYVGGAWTPTWDKPVAGVATPSGLPFGRAMVEAGFEASVVSAKGRSRHDFRMLEGTVTFRDLAVNGVLFAYDYQQVHRRPAFWVTTFFGKPRLYPVPIPLGFGFRTLEVDDRPASQRGSLDMEWAEFHVSWNPAQSNDMYNRLRIEAGADVGQYWEDRTRIASGLGTGRVYGGFTSAVRSRVSLGQSGLHYLFADIAYKRPTLVADAGEPTRAVNRVKAQVAYEAVFLAVNDQPLTFRLAANGTARDDAPSGTRNIEVGGTAGIRFSFWAPPRSQEPLHELEDP